MTSQRLSSSEGSQPVTRERMRDATRDWLVQYQGQNSWGGCGRFWVVSDGVVWREAGPKGLGAQAQSRLCAAGLGGGQRRDGPPACFCAARHGIRKPKPSQPAHLLRQPAALRYGAQHVLQARHSAREARDGEHDHRQDQRPGQHRSQVPLAPRQPEVLPVDLLGPRGRVDLREGAPRFLCRTAGLRLLLGWCTQLELRRGEDTAQHSTPQPSAPSHHGTARHWRAACPAKTRGTSQRPPHLELGRVLPIDLRARRHCRRRLALEEHKPGGREVRGPRAAAGLLDARLQAQDLLLRGLSWEFAAVASSSRAGQHE